MALGVAGLLAIGIVGAGAVVVTGMSASLFDRTSAPTGRLVAEPAQIAVIDGGTLRMDRQVVRLLGVDPPSRGRSCGLAADCGNAAANALADLVRQKPVSCALHGQDPMGRPLGICDAGGTDLNRTLVAAGWARAGSALPGLRQAESDARADRAGVWAAP